MNHQDGEWWEYWDFAGSCQGLPEEFAVKLEWHHLFVIVSLQRRNASATAPEAYHNFSEINERSELQPGCKPTRASSRF